MPPQNFGSTTVQSLSIDIGNTHAKLGVFQGNVLLFTQKLDALLVRDVRYLAKEYSFSHVILSSTRNLRKSLLKYLDKTFTFIHLDHLTPLPIDNAYTSPATLGRDRIAAAIGAWSSAPEENHLVIDIGTCITYDLVSDATFQGGNIAPGVHLRIRSMNDYTDKLPLVSFHYAGNLLGRSTEEALQNGAILGTICEIEAFILRTQRKYGRINVTLTGGDSEFFAKQLDSEIFVDPFLVLKGLNEILRYNAA